MTPQDLAALHARASTSPWSVESFEEHLNHAAAILVTAPHGFALGRAVLDEVELFQIATDPDFQRQGIARSVLAEFESDARKRGCARAFLEVAASNHAAQALYKAADWHTDGLRKSYYKRADGTREDALIMSKNL